MTTRVRPVVIACLGIHGAGKTTQATLLLDALRERGVDAAYVHPLAPAAGPRAIGHADRALLHPALRLLGRAARTVTLDDSPRGGPLRALARHLAATATVIRGALGTRRRLARRREHVLIVDRHAYDACARALWRYGIAPAFESLLLRAVPTPDLVVFLQAVPEEAYRRHKGQEWSLAQLRAAEQAYEQWIAALARRRPSVRLIRVPAGTAPGEAHALVLAAVLPSVT